MKRSLKPIAVLCTFLLVGSSAHLQAQSVAVNDDGAAPNARAMLDVNYSGTPKKGMLIPRMDRTQRMATVPVVPTPAARGLTVYQTNNFSTAEPQGFYIYDGTAWQPIYTGPAGWELGGNGGTNPAADFLGTTDNQPLVFRTNNAEVMRLDDQGDLGVGVIAPVEKLDVAGAIKLTGTSATNDAGGIRYNPAGYHEGNVDGTAAGWKKIQNSYVEVFGENYTQPGAVTCGSGQRIIIANNGTSNDPRVTPFTNVYNRARHQYLFRADELNVQLNQLFNDPTATYGLCANQNIHQIGFNVVAGTVRPWFYSVSIKHTTMTTLTGFDNTNDPLGRCTCRGAPANCTAATPANVPTLGLHWFTFADNTGLTPFQWDGTRNVIIEVCYLAGGFAGGQVNATVQATSGLSFNGSYGRYGLNSVPTCNSIGACGNTAGCGIASTGCSGGGGVNIRPEIVWNSFAPDQGIATAGPIIMSTGSYVRYPGGVLTEEPGGAIPVAYVGNISPYTFKGPGTISAEHGVYSGGSQLNDHVFDRYFDGRVAPGELDMFGRVRHYAVDEMVNYVEKTRHLPTMKGRAETNLKPATSIDDLTNQLWTTTETQALYLTELNDKVDGLEMLSTDRPLSSSEFERLRQLIAGMEHLTEAEKDQLLEKNRSRIQPNDKR